nr:flippase-like domain-containing protein [Allostreptomyces psammosilenae]
MLSRARPYRAAPDGPTKAVEVPVDEPLLPARFHRPGDLVKALLGCLTIALVLFIATIAEATSAGLRADIGEGTANTPPFVVALAGVVSSIAVLVVPLAFAVERLIKRDGLRVADGVLAAVLAHGVALAIDLWVDQWAPASLVAALTQRSPGGEGLTDAVHGYLAPVVAYMCAVGLARRPRWQIVLWLVVGLDGLAVLLGGYTTPMSVIVTVLIGWTVAHGTMYALGVPNVRPTGAMLLAGLRRSGLEPVSCRRAGGAEDTDRLYQVELADGTALDVTVLDREQRTSGFFYRLWRRLQLRGAFTPPRHSLQSLRQTLEQEALAWYAAREAGARTPRLVLAAELGPDAAILVHEHLRGRPMSAVPDEEITDRVLRSAWEQVRRLHQHRIVHRRLSEDALVVEPDGRVHMVDLGAGEVAAGDLSLRMDLAQLLTVLALRVGPERAVAGAADVLGVDAVAAALPLLQPVALDREVRGRLRAVNKERPEGQEELLSRIREQILLVQPQAPVEPVRLQRIRPRTLVTILAGAIAAYLLGSQLAHVDLRSIRDADWRWAALAVLASALSYVAAAMVILGFVPERISFWRTFLVQLAGSFVKLVAPAAVGGVAINTRFLQRSGIPPGQAVSSVGASQLFGMVFTIALLAVFGYLTGTERTPSALSPSSTVIAGILAAAVLALLVAAIPPARRFIVTQARSIFQGVVPRLLDLFQRPSKILTGAAGTLLLTLCFVGCLYASVRAFGGELSFAAVALVFLAGNAIGSAAPTPGGLGAVEATLSGGLTAVGLPVEVAVSATLLYRLLTLWLPVLPGWVAFSVLQRKEAL